MIAAARSPRPLWALCVLVLGIGCACAAAAQTPPASESLSTYRYRVEHRDLPEVLERIQPLLSPRGAVEIAADGRTLEIRDSLAALTRVARALAAYDLSPIPIALRVQLVWAGREPRAVPRETAPLSPLLLRQLRGLLAFDTYTLLAGARLEAREGDRVAYEFPTGHRVEFLLGNFVEGQQVRLSDFRVLAARGEAAGPRTLLRSSVNLRLSQPLVLGLTKSEASGEALLIVLAYEPSNGGG